VTQTPQRPKKLEIVEDGLHVIWQDGLETLLPHRYLRGNCGCAQCVDEITHHRHVSVDDVPSDVTIVEQMPIGRYAVALLFSDLHDSGIFPYRLLRSLAEGQGDVLNA
jgi:DUF971 family protein